MTFSALNLRRAIIAAPFAASPPNNSTVVASWFYRIVFPVRFRRPDVTTISYQLIKLRTFLTLYPSPSWEYTSDIVRPMLSQVTSCVQCFHLVYDVQTITYHVRDIIHHSSCDVRHHTHVCSLLLTLGVVVHGREFRISVISEDTMITVKKQHLLFAVQASIFSFHRDVPNYWHQGVHGAFTPHMHVV